VTATLTRTIRSLHARDLLAVEDGLRGLTVPILIVWGIGDGFFATRWAYWLRDAVAGAETVVEIPGRRLFFPDERPDELTAAIAGHWASGRANAA
jgi:pimeloyl-ACP methyl ester carboxylesterase